MLSYRLYFMGGTGHIIGHAEWTCEDDAEAELRAVQQHDGRAMELWCGARVVRRFPRRQDA